MVELMVEMLKSQYLASLSTVDLCIQKCPDEVWKRPVARFAYFQSAHHVLFFTDYYLSVNEEAFLQQDWHQENQDLLGDYEQMKPMEPRTVYTRDQLRRYLEFCRQKVVRVMDGESAESLSRPAEFPRKPFSRAELHLYNIRHIQHHAAQLILRLRLDSDVDIPWVRNGWKEE